jgi:hypothetical protein
MTPREQQIAMLKAMATAQILLEQLDAVKSSSLYVTTLKHKTKQYSEFLERHTRETMGNLYKIDSGFFARLQTATETLINATVEGKE